MYVFGGAADFPAYPCVSFGDSYVILVEGLRAIHWVAHKLGEIPQPGSSVVPKNVKIRTSLSFQEFFLMCGNHAPKVNPNA